MQAPRRAVVERLSSGVLQPLRNALTPYTFTVALEVWDDDAACQVVEIDRRPVPARKQPALTWHPTPRAPQFEGTRNGSRLIPVIPFSLKLRPIRETIETVAEGQIRL